MATKRVTISVTIDVAARMKRAAGGRRSVSAWVAEAVGRALAEDDLKRRLLQFCDDVPATPAEERQANASFDKIVKASRTRHGQSAA